jgi:hypothetical protein
MPAEPDDGDELTDAYNQVRRELDAEDDVSECGGALGATTTINTDGRRYHPACARGVVRPNSLRHRIQKSLGGFESLPLRQAVRDFRLLC